MCPSAEHFIGYNNNDLAGDIDTSKSTSGMLFFSRQVSNQLAIG
jgi:hypothetical protein